MRAPGAVEQAIHNFVDSGIYPEDAEVIAAELPSATLQSLSTLLNRARSDVKVRDHIRSSTSAS